MRGAVLLPCDKQMRLTGMVYVPAGVRDWLEVFVCRDWGRARAGLRAGPQVLSWSPCLSLECTFNCGSIAYTERVRTKYRLTGPNDVLPSRN